MHEYVLLFACMPAMGLMETPMSWRSQPSGAAPEADDAAVDSRDGEARFRRSSLHVISSSIPAGAGAERQRARRPRRRGRPA
jgi:hypothetical protein